MKMIMSLFAGMTLMMTLMPPAVSAETTIKLSEMHMCCGGCEKAIVKAVTGAGGEVTCERKAGKAVLKAADDAAAMKIMAKLAASGYHATSDVAKFKMKDISGSVDKEFTDLKVAGAHLCCGGCVKGLNKALKGVKGVTGTDAKKKAKTITIQGTFNGAEAIKALNKAGFHVSLAKK